MPIITVGKGGGFAGGATQNEQFSSAATAVPSGVITSLPWTKVGGASLFDLTVPAQAVVVVAGIYAFSLAVFCRSGKQAAGTSFYVEINLDSSGNNYATEATAPLDVLPAGISFPTMHLALTNYIPAGAANNVGVYHDVGADRNFSLFAFVQQVG